MNVYIYVITSYSIHYTKLYDEKENITLAKAEIINQVSSLANGDFSEDEMNNAILSIAGDYKSNYDSATDLSNWYFIQSIRGTDLTPEEAIEILSKLTKDDIIKAASELKLDTVYVMEGLDKGENE